MKIKDEIIKALADAYGIEPNEDTGKYDLDDYEWTSGCGGYNGYYSWLTLANVVEILTDALDYLEED